MSLHAGPIEHEATLPDGRVVRIRIGLVEDSYVPANELDTVGLELYAHGEHVAALTTVLDADDVSEAHELLQEVVAGLESGKLAPTAGALEPLVDRLR